MANINTLLSWAHEELIKSGLPTETAQNYAHQLLCHAYSVKHFLYIENIETNKTSENTFRKYIQQITKEHKPLAYIIGSTTFINATIKVEPPILIPRTETEFWVSKTIDYIKQNMKSPFQILDMCTGSGCIGISLAKEFTKSYVTLTDIDEQAISLTKQNCKINNLNNVEILKSDLFKDIPNKKYNVIVSNPPYIAHSEMSELDKSVKQWEAYHALSDGKTGETIMKKILYEAPRYLKNNGIIVCEGSPDNVPYIYKLLKQDNIYTHISILYDQYKKQRAILARI